MPRSLQRVDAYSDVPFRIQPNAVGDVGPTDALTAIRQSLFNILNTSPGQRALNPEFGCNVRRYLFEQFDEQTASRLGQTVKNSFERFEPRIRITKVNVVIDEKEFSYEVQVFYFIPSLSVYDNVTVELQRL
jgi:hypothetical protein